MANLAKFTIEGTASSPGGYDATTGQTVHFALEALATLVNRWELQVYDPADTTSPLASYGAPLLSLIGTTTGQRVQASTPAAQVTAVAPSGMNSWIVRSIVNGGVGANGKANPDYVWERMLVVRDGSGRRKTMASEVTQYGPDGWARAVNEMLAVAAPSLPSGTNLGDRNEWNGASWGILRAFVYDVRLFGATGNGTSDDTTAIQNAINACVAAGGGNVYFPPGSYRITAGLTCTSSNVRLLGPTGFAAEIVLDSVSAVDMVTFTGVACARTENLKFRGARVYTAGFAVKFDQCIKCQVVDCIVNDLGSGFWAYRSLQVRITNPDVRGIFGPYGVLYQGTAANNCHQLIIDGHGNFDNPPPGSVDGHPGRLWATSTAYTVGDSVLANGNLYYCAVSGTSASSGTGPSGVPTTNPGTARSTQIVDGAGALRWLFMGALTSWIEHREWANSVGIFGAIGCLNGGYGYRMINLDGSPGSAPAALLASPGWACDHNWGNAIDLVHGADAEIDGAWLSSTVFGSCVHVESTWGGDLRWHGGQVFGATQHGFQMESGHWSIDGCNVSCCSGAASNTYDGVNVAAGVSDWSVTDCVIGFLGNVTSNMRAGVNIVAGASDNYEVSGIRFKSNVSGGVVDNGTGKNKRIGPNQGNNEEFRPVSPGTKFGGFLPDANQTQGIASGCIFRRVGTSTLAHTYTVDTFAGATSFTLWFENYDTANDHTIVAATTFTFARGKGYKLTWNGTNYALAEVYILQGY